MNILTEKFFFEIKKNVIKDVTEVKIKGTTSILIREKVIKINDEVIEIITRHSHDREFDYSVIEWKKNGLIHRDADLPAYSWTQTNRITGEIQQEVEWRQMGRLVKERDYLYN
jgi:molybdenum cofactor biosynthesis enzyme MoaA